VAIVMTTTPVLRWLTAWVIQRSASVQMAQGRHPNHSVGFTPVSSPGSSSLTKRLPETQVHI
jgi:hypothetical protein